jgi:hypothetical protein
MNNFGNRSGNEGTKEMGARSGNPKGIVSFSPGLRGTSYPGCERGTEHNPEGVVSTAIRQRHNPFRVVNYIAGLPRVGARRANPGLNSAIPLGLLRGRYFIQLKRFHLTSIQSSVTVNALAAAKNRFAYGMNANQTSRENRVPALRDSWLPSLLASSEIPVGRKSRQNADKTSNVIFLEPMHQQLTTLTR